MSTIPTDRKYTHDHEWVKLQSDGQVAIGITDFAQKELDHVVYAELPPVEVHYSRHEACGKLESVKAVSEVYCPVDGKVIERNEGLMDDPESINSDPYGAWLFTLQPDSVKDLDQLMDAATYEKLLTEQDF
ncbi:MAG: glycine cleavage system protein GcvH [Methylococcales bacterium]